VENQSFNDTNSIANILHKQSIEPNSTPTVLTHEAELNPYVTKFSLTPLLIPELIGIIENKKVRTRIVPDGMVFQLAS
jgi:hypothetical protein